MRSRRLVQSKGASVSNCFFPTMPLDRSLTCEHGAGENDLEQKETRPKDVGVARDAQTESAEQCSLLWGQTTPGPAVQAPRSLAHRQLSALDKCSQPEGRWLAGNCQINPNIKL